MPVTLLKAQEKQVQWVVDIGTMNINRQFGDICPKGGAENIHLPWQHTYICKRILTFLKEPCPLTFFYLSSIYILRSKRPPIININPIMGSSPVIFLSEFHPTRRYLLKIRRQHPLITHCAESRLKYPLLSYTHFPNTHAYCNYKNRAHSTEKLGNFTWNLYRVKEYKMH